MQILANENVPLDAVELLRQRGHDVLWIRTNCPGIKDSPVLALACAEQRLLITFDKDYGELVYRRNQRALYGVVIFRISQTSSMSIAVKVADVLESRNDWERCFSVVEDQRIRMKSL